jgi:vacuolar protein sorting-associated protein 16
MLLPTRCGEDAVALLWKNTGIVMVGPYGDCIVLPYENEVHLVSEQDCCRVISSYSCDIIQRVPPSTEAIKKIGSTDPAALLYDAMEVEGSSSTYTYMYIYI